MPGLAVKPKALARQEEEVRFAADSVLEEDGFELPVPPATVSL